MRVLVIHNYYGSDAPSGENAAVDAEVTLLRDRGSEVRTVAQSSDGVRARGAIGSIAGGLSWICNPACTRDVRRAAVAFAPDVIHVHNTFPLISNGVFRALRGIAPRILTLHNYRLVCPAAVPVRNGTACTLCIDSRSAWHGVLHRCYRNSAIATAPLAIRATLDRLRGTWHHEVEAFIVLSDFQRRLLGVAGLPTELMHVRPNPYYGTPQPVSWDQRSAYAVFAGRVSLEKGALDLVDAWRLAGDLAPALRVIGDGPARKEMQRRAEGLPVEFTGSISRDAARREIARARLLIVPSRWFEGFPLVISEALAHGTPLVVADIGPLGEIVNQAGAGEQFVVGDPLSLWHAVRRMWGDDATLQRCSTSARAAYDRVYTDTAAHTRLLDIYERAGVPRSVTGRLS